MITSGKACGELREDLDVEAAATLFIGTIQGLVMQSLIAGDMNRMRVDAPRVFAIYLHGIRPARHLGPRSADCPQDPHSGCGA